MSTLSLDWVRERNKMRKNNCFIPAAFEVTESIVAPNGVIHAVYERAGAVSTGSL
jgi:hypothetical protein